MNNKECQDLIEKVKRFIAKDNNKRPDSEMPPCIHTFKEWGIDEIDSPSDDFDWKKFWKVCKKHFPLHSVAGPSFYDTPQEIIDKEYNKVPSYFHRCNYVHDKTKPKVLEIGFGYGGAAKRFHEWGYDYTGIDYVASGKTGKFPGKFIEIEESGIPKEILNQGPTFDIVYSTNVFQHLTQQQRLDYYKQAASILKKGGYLFVDMFCKDRKTFRKMYTKEQEENLPYATNFFGVHTKVPNRSDVIKALRQSGFKMFATQSIDLPGDERTDVVAFLATKK